MARALVVGWTMALLLAGAGARAARPPSVEKLAADAANAYRAGDYGKAAELLERAYQQQPLSALLYNAAKAYDKLNDADKALDRYTRYLAADDADPRLKAKAEARVAALREPREPAKPPKPLETPPPPTAPPPTPPPAVMAPPPPPRPADDPRERARRRDRGLGLGLGLTGVACLAAGLGLGLNAQSLHDQFDHTLIENDKRSLRDQAQAQAIAADVLYTLGGVAVVVGAYFVYRWLRAPSPSSSGRRAMLSPWWSPRGGGVSFEARF